MIAILLFFLARVFKALSDITKSSWKYSIFSKYEKGHWFYDWAGPGGSWKNKWELDSNGNTIEIEKFPWYYFGYKPKFKERFWLSSTWLVSLTDLWHTSERARSLAYALAAVLLAIQAAGFSIPLMGIPYLIWWAEPTLLNLIFSIVVWFRVSQLLGFTLFYDYVFKKR